QGAGLARCASGAGAGRGQLRRRHGDARAMNTRVASARRFVVKVGSSLVTDDGRGLDHDALAGWATQIAELKRTGKEIVLVSSGAIAEGIRRLGWAGRPSSM